jgi:single-stranded-DNA-specific exonuclease
LKKAFNIEISYYIHNSKEHGLNDKELFPKIEEDAKSGKLNLLFLPDSGTGDFKESKILAELGCQVIVLDHHEKGKIDNKSAIVINPHYVENYPNMNSSGTMVTWKFLRAIDYFEWTDYSNEFFDLVACSTISDSMNIQNLENRHFITLGLSDIKNKFLSEMILGDYRIKNSPPTIIDIAFFVIPMINGMVRSGTKEEKELMFRAMCGLDESFEYVKRDKTVIQESIYTRATRICTNAKSRQDRAIDKGIEIVLEDIEKFNRNDNKILFALCDDRLDKAFSGLVAQKLASRFNKPCVLLRENEKGDYFSGSIRNLNDSPLTNLKDFLESLGYTSWIQGHQSAAGIGLSKKQLVKTIELSNEKLKDYNFEPLHNVDFELDYLSETFFDSLNYILLPVHNLKQYWGQGLAETKILIKNIPVNSSKISFFGAKEKSEKKNNYKFEISEEFGIDVMKFRAEDDDYIFKNFGQSNSDFSWNGEDFKVDIIGKVARSEFNGEQRWSIIVEEMELVK